MNTSETSTFHFTENEPTSIVKDFNTFVNYIEILERKGKAPEQYGGYYE